MVAVRVFEPLVQFHCRPTPNINNSKRFLCQRHRFVCIDFASLQSHNSFAAQLSISSIRSAQAPQTEPLVIQTGFNRPPNIYFLKPPIRTLSYLPRSSLLRQHDLTFELSKMMNMLMSSSTAPPSNASNFDEDEGCDSSGAGDHSGHIDDSTTSFGTTKKGGESSSESSTLARAETTAVNRSKMLVLLVLSVAAVGVGVATYIFATTTEQNDFKQQVRGDQDHCLMLTCVSSSLTCADPTRLNHTVVHLDEADVLSVHPLTHSCSFLF